MLVPTIEDKLFTVRREGRAEAASLFDLFSYIMAGEAIERARNGVGAGLGYEYVASDLRDTLRAVEDLTGKVTADRILDFVFSRFCVGK